MLFISSRVWLILLLACGYVMYMLIDRLGDEFNHLTVTTEMGQLCPRVQWVFKSACDHITKIHGPKVLHVLTPLFAWLWFVFYH